MIEFFNIIFGLSNIVPTTILCFCLVYWLIVIIGIIDLDLVDVDIDIDADMEADTDLSGGTEAGVAWLNKVLYFFNLGRIPFMLWLSIIMLITWFGTVVINYLLLNGSFLIGLAIFFGVFIAAVVIAKPLTFPLVKMFDALEKADGLKSVVGQMAEVVYPNKGKQPGEVEIVYEGSHIRIFAIPSNKEIVLIKNQKVLVIAPSKDDPKVYMVEPYN